MRENKLRTGGGGGEEKQIYVRGGVCGTINAEPTRPRPPTTQRSRGRSSGDFKYNYYCLLFASPSCGAQSF